MTVPGRQRGVPNVQSECQLEGRYRSRFLTRYMRSSQPWPDSRSFR